MSARTVDSPELVSGKNTVAPQGTEKGRRLLETQGKPLLWRRWGPYVSERAWGTVREDYSAKPHLLLEA